MVVRAVDRRVRAIIEMTALQATKIHVVVDLEAVYVALLVFATSAMQCVQQADGCMRPLFLPEIRSGSQVSFFFLRVKLFLRVYLLKHLATAVLIVLLSLQQRSVFDFL